MPSLSASYPSFQLGLLKPTLEREGIPVQTFSMFMYFGAQVGWRINQALSDVYPCMVGEWIWTKTAFGDFADNQAYLDLYGSSLQSICHQAGCTIDDLCRIRDQTAPAFIDFCVDSVDWTRFGLIGFSVVFQQTLASIALAQALKRRYPSLPIIMGGASFEDDIAEAIMRGCPAVDYIHCGDAEESFPEMIRRLYDGRSMRHLRGIMWRDAGHLAFAGRAPNLTDLNTTPVPDFDEYFYARREAGFGDGGVQDVLLPIETARGCWWGMKNHCTFCGLNRSGMEFRAKDADHILEQLESLANRYGILDFNAIDNIMAPEYVTQLFGRLVEAHSDFRLHYEIRPSLTRTQLKQMRMGGLFSVQPGIESFSTHLLKVMKKHTTGMRNLELLKWCTYYGINNLYNILVRFPGETAEDYQLHCRIIPTILHWQPPWAIAKARADRGSPMYTEPASQSIKRLVPSPCYEYLFPRAVFDLQHVSYYFEHDMDNTLLDGQYETLFDLVADWQQRWQQRPRPSLTYRKAMATMIVDDQRHGAARVMTYCGHAVTLNEYCADARSRQEIAARFEGADWIEPALTDFVDRNLMICLDARYLSLALPENPYW
jgi:ribosomal peptide maturation radical SAM protein 1